MKIKKQLAGQTLIILMMAVMIIALLTLNQAGMFSGLMGTKQSPGTVRVDLNKIQQETDSYNQRVKQEMNGGVQATGTSPTSTSPGGLRPRSAQTISSSTEDYNSQLQNALNNQ